jgi:hypothetical protein
MDDAAEQEVVSLSGVRRLVLHARDALKRTSQNPGYVNGAAGVEAYADVAKARAGEAEARQAVVAARDSARNQEEQAQAWMDDYTELEAAVQRTLGLDPDGEPLEVTEYAKRLAALQASGREGAPVEPSPSHVATS